MLISIVPHESLIERLGDTKVLVVSSYVDSKEKVMNIDTWALVLATFLGPVFAILVSFWREGRRSIYSRKLSAFRTLMSTRRAGISPDHVGALNLVEVDFYGVKNVEQAWIAHKRHLNSDASLDKNWNETKERLLADLLYQMSIDLKFKIPALEIFKGGYAPLGWQFRDEHQEIALRFVSDLALGKKNMPIEINNNQSSEK